MTRIEQIKPNQKVREALFQNFSQFGLLHRLHLGEGDEGAYFAYVQVW